MTERVDIANQALTLLGADPITSFEDETVEARLCQIHYGPCRDAVLEEAEWNFATIQFEPALLEDPPLYGYEMAFGIPGDVMRVTDVTPKNPGYSWGYPGNPSGRILQQAAHQIQGRTIHANEEIVCRGIQRVENEGLFTPSFEACLVSYLAYRISSALTESNSKRDQMLQMYTANLKKAEGLDGMSNTSRRLRTAAIVSRR